MSEAKNYERRILALERKVADLEFVCALSFHLLASYELTDHFWRELREARHHLDPGDRRGLEQTSFHQVAEHLRRLT